MAEKKLYWCYKVGEEVGSYVIATSAGKAKYLYFLDYRRIMYVDIRCNVMTTDVDQNWATGVVKLDSDLYYELNKQGVYYEV